MNYKYCLIVSQYRRTIHSFPVEIDENFLEKAKQLANELIVHKRGNNEYWISKEDYLGDLNYNPVKDNGDLRARYNINDAGDIYFINVNSVSGLIYNSLEYEEQERRSSRGYQKKVDEEDTKLHHNKTDIKNIVLKHFEII